MIKQVFLRDLQPGMSLTQPLVSSSGSIVMEAGTVLTDFILGMLQNPSYMQGILPEGVSFDEVKLDVFVEGQEESLSLEDLSSAGAKTKEDGDGRPDPSKESLLDPEYVKSYDAVIDTLRRLLNPQQVNRGIDLDSIGQIIANRQVDKLCDGARAVAQIHNMNREGSYLFHHSLHVEILAGRTVARCGQAEDFR